MKTTKTVTQTTLTVIEFSEVELAEIVLDAIKQKTGLSGGEIDFDCGNCFLRGAIYKQTESSELN